MLGQTSRAALRRAAPRALPLYRSTPPRRTFILSPPAGKRGTWKGAVARWGLVIGGVYWYSTTTAFAEDNIRHDLQQRINELPIAHSEDENTLPTLDDISAARKQRLAAIAATSDVSKAPISDESAPSMSTGSSNLSAATSQAAIQSADEITPAAGSGSPAELEEEASQQGAFNEETGEINWDCPCLGGMAYGPCGPEFREAFSCFVYSKEDPKGIDCIDRFKGMQECFRQYPEHYGAELADEEDPSMDEFPDAPGAEAPAMQSTASTQVTSPEKVTFSSGSRSEAEVAGSGQRSLAAKEQVQRENSEGHSESKSAVPKDWHDTRSKNEGK